ncbi:MAG: hypothetical protein AAGK21_18290, partial [Bacteroidota bacterium]
MTRLTLLAALGAAFLVGPADAQPQRPDVSALIERATSGLDLTAQQQSRLGALSDDYADAEAGALWSLSADVAAVLTDAQIDQLQEAQQARRADRRQARGERDRRGMRARGMRRGGRARGGQRMTSEQRAAVREAMQDVRPQARSLVEQFRAGDLSDEAFVAEVRTLREDAMTRLGAALPDAMAERLTRMTTRRDATKAAREDALGLTDDQKDAVQALALDRLREG